MGQGSVYPAKGLFGDNYNNHDDDKCDDAIYRPAEQDISTKRVIYNLEND